MKATSLEHAHAAGALSIRYAALAGGTYLATAGADGKVRLLDESGGLQGQTDDLDVDGPLFSLAISPNAQTLAVGKLNSVPLHKMEGSMDMIEAAVVSALPVRALAFDPAGSRLAAAADEGCLSVVDVSAPDSKPVVLHTATCAANARGLAWDPEGTYLAVVHTDGTLAVWDSTTGTAVWQERCMHAVDTDLATSIGISWSPDGSRLAAPAKAPVGDVAVYARLRWGGRPLCSLGGVHTKPALQALFSPNGAYLLTAALDNHVVVWDVRSESAVAQLELQAPATSACWHPSCNSAAVAFESGAVTLLGDVLPADMPGPQEAIPQRASEAPEQPVDGAESGEAAALVDDDADDPDGAARPSRPGSPSGGSDGGHEGGSAAARGLLAATVASAAFQPAFQPGACPQGDDTSFLQFNMAGHVLRTPLDGGALFSAAFWDQARHSRKLAPIRSPHATGLAALSGAGMAVATSMSQTCPATLSFQPYNALTAMGAWERALPCTEQALSVAAGDSFVALATDTPCVHVFSCGGLQLAAIALTGQPVALAARGSRLAMVWHRALPAPDGTQSLGMKVVDVDTETCVMESGVALSAAASLRWLCLSDVLAPVTQDSRRVLRMWSPAFGGAWTAVLDAAGAQEGSTEDMWPVGVQQAALHYVRVPLGMHPQPHPLPEISAHPLPGPQLPEIAAAGENESKLVCMRMRLACLRHTLQTQPTLPDLDAASELPKEQLQADKLLLRAFNEALKSDNLDVALQLVQRCELDKTLGAAIKLANHKRKGLLAERIEAVLRGRMAAQEAEDEAAREQPVPPAQPVAVTCAPQQPTMGNENAAVVNVPEVVAPPTAHSRDPLATQEPAARKRPVLASKNPFARAPKAQKSGR